MCKATDNTGFEGGVVKGKVVKVEAPSVLDVKFEEFRCKGCRRVLALVAIVEGSVVVKCKRCKAWNALDIQSTISDNGSVKVG
jgi:LSD1 subclass zinc finger protein